MSTNFPLVKKMELVCHQDDAYVVGGAYATHANGFAMNSSKIVYLQPRTFFEVYQLNRLYVVVGSSFRNYFFLFRLGSCFFVFSPQLFQ